MLRALVTVTVLGLIPSPRLEAQAKPAGGTAAALYADAKRLDSLGQVDEARARFVVAIGQAEREPDSLTLALARYEVGFILWGRTQYDSALTYLRAALDGRNTLTNQAQIGRIYNTTGASYYHLGLYEPALDAFLAALEARRLAHDTLGVVRTLTNIGKTYHDWGQWARAHASLDEAITLARRFEQGGPGLGYALISKAFVAIDERRFPVAEALITQSVAAYGQSTTPRTTTDSIDSWELTANARALLLVRSGRAREALPLLEAIRQSAVARGNQRSEALTLIGLGEAQQAVNDLPAARLGFQEALTLSRQIGQRAGVLKALHELARLEDALRHPAASVGYFKAFDALRDTVFDQNAAIRIATREAHVETERVLQENAAQEALISRQRTLVLLSGGIVMLALVLLFVLVRDGRRARVQAAELRALNDELRDAMGQVKVLSGLIPICAHCKKVRDDQGYWNAVETFIGERSDAKFSHSICQSCGPKLYGDVWADVAAEMTPP